MSIKFNLRTGNCGNNYESCLKKDGCPPNVCPDFLIRRHDTRPFFKVAIEDCDGPMDFNGLIIEANMWALAKLKTNIDSDDTYFRLADDIGFEQVMVGDIIVMDRVRLPEKMLVTGFDEQNKLIRVQRAYHGTTASAWNKGTVLRIFRILNAPAVAEMSYEDIQNIDGTTDKDVLQNSYLVYEWEASDTCLPGCYWFEFKVIKMFDVTWFLPGGNWVGAVHQHEGAFYTGTTHTDSSVKLSFNQLTDKYILPNIVWVGEMQLYTDDNYYTGTSHDDGSVLLKKSGVSSDDVSYDDTGIVNLIPSFTDMSLTPNDFGCALSDGVEWMRRFPMNGEGFLIKIGPSPTTE